MDYTAKELKRQINFTKSMKVRATEKYEAKMQAYDEKIAEVKSQLDALED